MQTLTLYLDQNGLKNSEFAKQVGISANFLSEIMRKDKPKSPSLNVARSISEATGGAVPIQCWGKFSEVFDAIHEQQRKFASCECKGRASTSEAAQ